MNTSSFSLNSSRNSDGQAANRVKTFVLPGISPGKGVACAWRQGNKFSIFTRSQKANRNPLENTDGQILNIRQDILIFHPILRKLINESNGTFLSLQKTAEVNKTLDNRVEFLKHSRQYRSIIRVCIESLQEAVLKQAEGVEKDNLLTCITIFYSIECVWHLCEILYIDNVPGDYVLPFLLEWVRFHFPCHEQTAAHLLESCEHGSEDHPEYWDTVVGMVVQGRVDVARALMKLHSATDSNEFKLVDNCLKSMPVYTVYGGISTGEFTISWKHWQAECRGKLSSQVFSSQPHLELIMRLITGDYTAFESILPKYDSWLDILGGWTVFTAPWARRHELRSAAAACAGMRGAGRSALHDLLRPAVEGDLHQVIHEIQQISDNGWFATHLTDILFHCDKLKILDKHQVDVTSRLRDSLVLEYGSLLMEHSSLWACGLSYLAACAPEGPRRAELLLERLPAPSEPKALRVIAEAQRHGLDDVVRTICACVGARHLSNNRTGAALAWGMRGRNSALCARAADAALRGYTERGALPARDLLPAAGPGLLLHHRALLLGETVSNNRTGAALAWGMRGRNSALCARAADAALRGYTERGALPARDLLPAAGPGLLLHHRALLLGETVSNNRTGAALAWGMRGRNSALCARAADAALRGYTERGALPARDLLPAAGPGLLLHHRALLLGETVSNNRTGAALAWGMRGRNSALCARAADAALRGYTERGALPARDLLPAAGPGLLLHHRALLLGETVSNNRTGAALAWGMRGRNSALCARAADAALRGYTERGALPARDLLPAAGPGLLLHHRALLLGETVSNNRTGAALAWGMRGRNSALCARAADAALRGYTERGALPARDLLPAAGPGLLLHHRALLLGETVSNNRTGAALAWGMRGRNSALCARAADAALRGYTERGALPARDLLPAAGPGLLLHHRALLLGETVSNNRTGAALAWGMRGRNSALCARAADAALRGYTERGALPARDLLPAAGPGLLLHHRALLLGETVSNNRTGAALAWGMRGRNSALCARAADAALRGYTERGALPARDLLPAAGPGLLLHHRALLLGETVSNNRTGAALAWGMRGRNSALCARAADAALRGYTERGALPARDLLPAAGPGLLLHHRALLLGETVSNNRTGAALAWGMRGRNSALCARAADAALRGYTERGALPARDLLPAAGPGLLLHHRALLLGETVSNNRTGAALAWGMRGRNSALCARAADAALRGYTERGALPARDLLPAAGPGLLLHHRALLLGKYCDFHRLYKNREFKSAGKLLISLMTSKIAPDYFWETLLLDALPLLESDELVFSAADTFEIMLCVELRAQLDGDKAELLRLALARNLARSLLAGDEQT